MFTKRVVVVMVLACVFFTSALFSCPNVILVKVNKEIMCLKDKKSGPLI